MVIFRDESFQAIGSADIDSHTHNNQAVNLDKYCLHDLLETGQPENTMPSLANR